MVTRTDTVPDDTWRILKSLPERPETVPRGYEFLPDAINRDVAPHGPSALQLARQALAEGDVAPILLTHLGHREPIARRIWDKWPLARKVYPRFRDGKARIGLDPYAGPHAVGWVFVRKGAFRAIVREAWSDGGQSSPSPPTTVARSRLVSQSELERWYQARIQECEAGGRIPSREEDWAAACQHFAKAIPRNRVRDLRRRFAPPDWQKPGRRAKKSGRN